jgi:uncharacterized membrane protein HdeD (DUF308 family)
MAHAPTAGAYTEPRAGDPTEALRKARRRLLTTGVLSLILGAVAIVVPAVATVTIANFVGWILVFAGLLQAFDAFTARRSARLLLAALTLAAGVYLLVAPLQGTFTLTVMLVLWFVTVGVFRIAVGSSEWRVPGSAMLVAGGALDLLLGLLIAERLPESANWAIGLLVGIDLIFTGVVLIILSRALAHP